MVSVLERAGPNHPGRGVLEPRFGLPEPVPQYPHKGRRIDFAYPELLFGIEANSVEAHAAKEDVQRNAEKANDLIEWCRRPEVQAGQ